MILRGMYHSVDMNNIKKYIESLEHQVRNITNACHTVTKKPLHLFLY